MQRNPTSAQETKSFSSFHYHRSLVFEYSMRLSKRDKAVPASELSPIVKSWIISLLVCSGTSGLSCHINFTLFFLV